MNIKESNMPPLISIIIPIYNTEKFLSACLNSMCDQTFKEIEVLCINDGSTDRSGEILAEYAKNDSRFRVFDQENSGSGTARNRGLADARGKYIMFCDSDDLYEPNMCERMYQSIEEQNVDFVMCNTFVEHVDRVCNVPQEHFFPNLEGKQIFTNEILLCLNVMLWNKIFRKDLIDHYKISFSNGMHGIDDIPFSLSYFFVSKNVCFLNEKLYHYVQRTGSFVEAWKKNTELKQFVSFLELLKLLYNFLEQSDLLQKKGLLFLQYYFSFIKRTWPSIPTAHYREILDKIRSEVSQFRIQYSLFSFPSRFFKALLAEDYRTLFRILYHIPCGFTLFFRKSKYTLFEKILFGKRKEIYRRKKIRVLYKYRQLARALSFLSDIKISKD